jgi:hypothetical protein
MTPDILQYLSLTLAPVIILWGWALILKALKNKRQQKHDKN